MAENLYATKGQRRALAFFLVFVAVFCGSLMITVFPETK